SAIVGPGDLGRRPGACSASRRGRDAGRPARARDPAPPARAGRPANVRTAPHAPQCCVGTLCAYRPDEVLAAVRAEIFAVRRTTPGDDEPTGIGADVPPRVRVIDVSAPGHNLLRSRPDEVTAAILGG